MVTYNALSRGTWEPILEPITDPKDDQAPQTMWYLRFDVSTFLIQLLISICRLGGVNLNLEGELLLFRLFW